MPTPAASKSKSNAGASHLLFGFSQQGTYSSLPRFRNNNEVFTMP
jgi:hypothetical protein